MKKEDFYRYDMHIHTKYSSCSNISPSLILKKAAIKNLDGIAVTDHDTIRGALEVLKLNKSKDFKVIVGEEVNTSIGHILVYNLNKEIKPSNIAEVLDEVKKQGAIACIAHPFATLRIKFKEDQNMKKIPCIETFNGRNSLHDNKKAEILAEKLKKAKIGGSDAHYLNEIGTGLTKFKGDFAQAVKKKQTIAYGTNNRIKTLFCKSRSGIRLLFH